MFTIVFEIWSDSWFKVQKVQLLSLNSKLVFLLVYLSDQVGWCCCRMYRSMQPMIDTSVVEEVPAKEPRFHLLPAKSSLKAKDRPQSAVIASNSSGGYSREAQPPKRCSFPKAFPGNSVVESNDSRTSNFIRYAPWQFFHCSRTFFLSSAGCCPLGIKYFFNIYLHSKFQPKS